MKYRAMRFLHSYAVSYYRINGPRMREFLILEHLSPTSLLPYRVISDRFNWIWHKIITIYPRALTGVLIEYHCILALLFVQWQNFFKINSLLRDICFVFLLCSHIISHRANDGVPARYVSLTLIHWPEKKTG